MAFFMTRRTYNAAKKKFTNNLAALTRPVMLNIRSGGGYEGGIISETDWLDHVMHRANGKGVVVYIHGFNTSQHSMLQRHGLIKEGLRNAGFEGVVVAFDWPSQGIVTAYDPDLAMAKAVAPFLPAMLQLLVGRLGSQPLHLLCHSMGCYLTLRALRGVGEHATLPSVRLDQVIFAAGDMDAEQLRRGAGAALVMAHRCTRLTNYHSTADRVLSLSGIINGGRQRVGHIGMPDLIEDNAVDLYTTAQFRKYVPTADQSDYMISHNWYYSDDGFFRDAALTLAGTPEAAMPTRRATNTVDRALLT